MLSDPRNGGGTVKNFLTNDTCCQRIGAEIPEDAAIIRAITSAAFEGAPHSSGTEAAIVDALRAAGALTVSLVAVQNGEIVGHVAFSPVTIDCKSTG